MVQENKYGHMRKKEHELKAEQKGRIRKGFSDQIVTNVMHLDRTSNTTCKISSGTSGQFMCPLQLNKYNRIFTLLESEDPEGLQ